MKAHSRARVVEAVRDTLSRHRHALRPGEDAPPTQELLDEVQAALRLAETERLRRAVNATGVVLHTGLGRAVLPSCAAEGLGHVTGYCNLQVDLATGRRGRRNFTTEDLLLELTGAEAAIVVNNNAAATLLVLTALCTGREVIVSRGQLVEIGGSFRLPDCIRSSGAHMVEVGTTNKTHLRDYEGALSENTGAVLHVNPSNYRITGFAQQVPVAELTGLASRGEVVLIDDLGCGALVDLRRYGLPHEPTVRESVDAGVDVVLFSGDKLIGGPQAGIIVGKKHPMEKIRKHPLTRMLRVGKLTDAALEHTLRLFLAPDDLPARHPVYRMLTVPAEELAKRAEHVIVKLQPHATHLEVRCVPGESAVGGGTLPDTRLPSVLLVLRSTACSSEKLCRLLRRNEPPIIARVRDQEVLLDMRTLQSGETEVVVEALVRIGSEENP